MIHGFLKIVAPIFAETSTSEAPLVLVERGRPQATIVIAEQATDQAKEAAEILRTYVERITGAELPICTENEATIGARILVGHSAAVKALGVTPPSGVTSQMNEEGFVIQGVGNDLVLAGNEDWHYRGTVYSVYHFLELLGCRWFFPGSYGEVVPRMPTITVSALNIEERPSFRMRNIWYSGWMPSTATDHAALRKWYDCNKAHPMYISTPGDGSIIRLAPPERYFDSHREIYAVDANGERSREMLCLSEPETVQIAVRTITDAFRADPMMFTFGFAPPDGTPMCHCERCQGRLHGITAKHLGRPSLSDTWFHFVNEIAKAVKREFPDRWLLTNGYANRVYPPEGIADFSDNIGIQFAFLQCCTLHRIGDPGCWQRQDYAEILKRWTDLCPVIIYDYDPGVGLENLPFPALHNLRHDMLLFKERGVWGFWTEGQNTWLRTHLNYYIRAKLMWKVGEDVDALVRDYCETFYGRAAEAIERYIWALEGAVDKTKVHAYWRGSDQIPWGLIFPGSFVEELHGSLTEAAQLAKTPEHQLHMKALQISHEHLIAFLNMQQAGDAADYGQALLWADRAQEARDGMADIYPALLPTTPDWVAKSNITSLEGMRNLYQSLADRAGGPLGELVVMLPEVWEFRTDPFDDGLIRQWYLPNRGEGWDKIKTTLYWENQGYQDELGHGYVGFAWYRTAFDAPASAANPPSTGGTEGLSLGSPPWRGGSRSLKLTFGGVYHQELWVWLNGLLVYVSKGASSQRPFDVDVTGHVRPGQTNHIAVRIKSQGIHNRAQGGIYRRVFLWLVK